MTFAHHGNLGQGSTGRARCCGMEELAHLIDAIAHFVGVCVWPALAAFVLYKFYAPIGRALEKITDLRVKAPGVDISAKIQAAAALGAASASRDGAPEDKDQIAFAITESVDLPIKKRARIVLWVDDQPESNEYEREALDAIGIRLVLAKSTEDALRIMQKRKFSAIISDMGRPPDDRAGYTLLSQLAEDHPPFIIYSSVETPQTRNEAKMNGAFGSTNHPTELFNLVVNAAGLK